MPELPALYTEIQEDEEKDGEEGENKRRGGRWRIIHECSRQYRGRNASLVIGLYINETLLSDPENPDNK